MSRASLTLLSILLSSCANEPSELGANFFNGGTMDVSYIDSVSVKISTIKYEELVTSEPDRLLIGHHDDEKLGAVFSAPYFQLSVPSTNPLNKYSTEYNYAVLVLKYDGYSYYDTLLENRYSVYRVNEKIETDATGSLYNHSRFELDTHSLGTATFKPRPHKDDSLAIGLDDALGRDLYEKILNQSPVVADDTEFQRYFRGIAVLPDISINGSLLGFTPDAELRLYYTDKSVIPANDDRYVSFSLNSNGLFFNSIAADITGTDLDGTLLTQEDNVDAALTDNESYIQGGIGLSLRMDLPYIKKLRDMENLLLLNAVLEIHPVRHSYDALKPLPGMLTAFVIYPNNETYTEYSTSIQQLVLDDIPRDTYYSVDVTDYVETMLQDDNTENQYALLFRLEDKDFRESVNRIFVSSERTKLRINYATIKNN